MDYKVGEKLIMIKDGSYGCCFKKGEIVRFEREDYVTHDISVVGLYEGRETFQTIVPKDAIQVRLIRTALEKAIYGLK